MAYIPPNQNGQANMANSAPVVVASDQSDLPIVYGNAVTQTYNVAGVITINTILLTIDLQKYRGVSIQCTSMGTAGVVTPEWSNNNATWVAATIFTAAGASAATFNGAGLWNVQKQARYLRLRLSTATTAGTTTIYTEAYQTTPQAWLATAPVSQSGTWTVQPGNTANTTAWLANPLTPAVTTTGDTGAKTATGNGATITNATSKGAHIVVNMGAVTGTTPTCTIKVQGSADGGTTWYDIPSANTASLTATGVYGIMIYPGLAAVAGTTTSGTTAQVNSALPRTWRIVWTIGGTTPSFTITNVQVSYLI